MKTQRLMAFGLLLYLPCVLCSCTVGIEKVQYDVIKTDGAFQIRQYRPYLVAETRVDADFKEAGNVAFRPLFNYISGANRSTEKIAMTAPVTQQPTSEKIAMTAPVTQQAAGGQYVISFVMPATYTLETIPQPTDEAVVIKQIPSYKAVAIRYSGTWAQSRYEANKDRLETYMKEQGLTAAGDPIWARYNPPFELWFMRRNEVVIPIE